MSLNSDYEESIDPEAKEFTMLFNKNMFEICASLYARGEQTAGYVQYHCTCNAATVMSHIRKLKKARLAELRNSSGSAGTYRLTEKGKRYLEYFRSYIDAKMQGT